MIEKPTIGFIGQWYIGKNYADNFEERGYKIVRYSLEEQYRGNKEQLKDCAVIFIAVPTPTTPSGADTSIIQEAITLVPKGAIAVIKSTVLPGTTESIQQANSEIFVLHSPEFLSEKTAREDVDSTDCTVIGIPLDTPEFREKANLVASILPPSPLLLCTSSESEFVKYAHNIHGVVQILYANLLYDLAEKIGVRWEVVKEYMSHDRYMVDRYATPVHASGVTEQRGRGAGGRCFIKDFAAFKNFHKANVNNEKSNAILQALEDKNIELLVSTNKDINLLKEVYGQQIPKN